MASSRQARPTGRKAKASAVKTKHKVVKKPSAETAGGSERKEPYPVSRTRK